MAKKRSRTREARQRRQKQRRHNQRLLVLIAIVVVAVVAIAVVFVSSQPVEAFIPDSLSDRYEAIQRSYSPDGYPRLGDPDAPVTLEEYASFSCPGCEAFHSDSFDDLLERVRDGQVLFTYVPLQTGSVPNAPGAARTALCAGQQGMFWEMHDVLFDWQTRYGNTAFSQNRLLAGVESLSLSGSAFTSCFNSGAISATLEAALNEDVASTPAIRVNGVTLEAGQTIPSATTILAAIDDATPDNWWLSDEDVALEQAEEPTDEGEADASVAEEVAELEAESDETSAEDVSADQDATTDEASDAAEQDESDAETSATASEDAVDDSAPVDVAAEATEVDEETSE